MVFVPILIVPISPLCFSVNTGYPIANIFSLILDKFRVLFDEGAGTSCQENDVSTYYIPQQLSCLGGGGPLYLQRPMLYAN